MGKALQISYNDLYRLYVVENKTIKNIANIYSCCDATISSYLKKYKIPTKTPSTWLRGNKHNKKYNVYNLSGNYGIGITSNTNREFYFDLEDFDKIKNICWCEDADGYICGRDTEHGKSVKLHNVVMEASYVDHIKHKLNDNRKSQLRVACDRLNARNRKVPSNNTSGYVGVSWKIPECKWRACITIDGKHRELGLYSKKEDAIKARKDAENLYFKDWSYDNSMKKEICE